MTRRNRDTAFASGSVREATPGLPKDSGSRQQTHAHQSSQSGSPAFDKEITRRGGAEEVPTIPTGAK
jgi:hypothetical protein